MALERTTQPAAVASARVARAGALLGTLGLASSVFVVSRLVETWRVTPGAATHEISIIGERLSDPAANLAAIVVLALALVGLAVAALTAAGAVREIVADRRFASALLDEPALGAVLEHERHHARRRDPLRLAAGRVAARALFFVPGLRELVHRQQSLAELSADERAIAAAPGNRSALAGQLAAGSTTLAPPLLSSRPCVVVLATIPAVLGLAVVRLRRRLVAS